MRQRARLAASVAGALGTQARSNANSHNWKLIRHAYLGPASRPNDIHSLVRVGDGSAWLLKISPWFYRVQWRNCFGNQEDEDNRSEALEKLRGLVDGWVLEGEGEIVGEGGQHLERLSSSLGLLDDWNLEDWHDAEAEPPRDVSRNRLVGSLQEEKSQDASNLKSEAHKPQEKKVVGMDKDLPPRVLVEFSEATSLTELTSGDINKLFNFSKGDEERFFSEGVPKSYIKEFDISCTNALLIRSQFLKLVDHLTKMTEKKNKDDEPAMDVANKEEGLSIEPVAYMSLNQRKKLARERRMLDKADLGLKKQIVLDGLPGSGKSVVLAMLVQWARSKGWLVCYIPSGKKWTHSGLYYKNELTGFWDNPVEATSMLQDFLKSHSDILKVLPCRVFDSIPLGEGPGIGQLSGSQEVPVREGFTLRNLVQLGIDIPHAAVGVVVRLRKELSLVVEVPVLIAVDEFNSWFTFSGFFESYNEFGRRQIHARELAMVHAFRDMTYGPFMIGAFSHCTNVGKLPKQLPGISIENKLFLNRYDFLEASIMLKHYMRVWCPKARFGKRARRALYMLTNGNATELRDTAFLTAAGAREELLEVPAA